MLLLDIIFFPLDFFLLLVVVQLWADMNGAHRKIIKSLGKNCRGATGAGDCPGHDVRGAKRDEPLPEGRWLTIDTGVTPLQLRLRPGATDALKRFGSDALNLAMVMGRARTGKSFLMNKIMDESGFFKVRSGNIPCTVGVDVSPVASYEDHFGGGGRGGLIGGARRVAFLDVEGQGDQGVSYDVVLAAPLLLVSKVVIFNWNGKMAKDEMLQKLGVLAEAAKKIKPDAKAGASSKDFKLFGHLHVVLRDQADVAGVQEMLFEEEDGPATDDALEARNKIRKIIRQSFASYRVWGLPAPVESATRLERGAFTEDDVTPAFQEAIDALRDVLAVQLREPHVLCGRRLGAADIAEFMQVLTASINAGNKDIVPQSLFQQMETRLAGDVVAGVAQTFDAWAAKEVAGLMPLAPAELRKLVEAEKARHAAALAQQLSDIGEQLAARAKGCVSTHIDKAHATLALANDKHIGIKAQGAKQAAINALQQEEAKAKARTQLQDEAALSAAFEQTKTATLKSYDAAVAAFKDVPEVIKLRAEVVSQAQSVWSAIQSYNKVLTVQQEKKKAEEEKKKAEEDKKKAEEDKKKAEEAKRQAEELASRSSACGGGGGGGGCMSMGGMGGLGCYGSGGGGGFSGGGSGLVYSGGAWRTEGGGFASKATVQAAGHTWRRAW